MWMWGTESRVSARATTFPVLERYLSFSVAKPHPGCEMRVECETLGAAEERSPSVALQGVRLLSSWSLNPHSVLPLLAMSWGHCGGRAQALPRGHLVLSDDPALALGGKETWVLN